MRQFFTTLVLLLVSITVSLGQNIPAIHNDDIEQSRRYIKGNAFQRDLLLYVDMLAKTHPYYADESNRAELMRSARTWYKECGKIEEATLFRAYLERIASQLNDGHTSVVYWQEFDMLFPIQFDIDGSNPVIIEVSTKDREDLLGREVVAINGLTMQEIVAKAHPLLSADNSVNFENTVREFLAFADFWGLMGFSNEVLNITLDDGSEVAIEARSKRSGINFSLLQRNAANRVTAQRNVLFDYQIYDKEGICYLQFNQFADRLTYPQYPQLARFDELVAEMMAEMSAKGIETLVVDLQYNGGGNSTLGDVLLSWLHPHRDTESVSVELRMSELLAEHYPYYREFTVDGKPLEMGTVYNPKEFDNSSWNKEIDYTAPQDPSKHVYNFDDERIFRGNVVFIQGKDSFSSSTILLTMARDNGIGIIVGELSGGRPSHYGDVLYGQLPNTATLITVSHKHFVRPNRAAMDKEYIYPDVEIELNDPDRDLVWEWIVENYGKEN